MHAEYAKKLFSNKYYTPDWVIDNAPDPDQFGYDVRLKTDNHNSQMWIQLDMQVL